MKNYTKRTIALFTIVIAFFFISDFVSAQEAEAGQNTSETYTDLGADLVSSYVWRGLMADAAPNIQGWGEFGINNFTTGIWASANFTGTFSETDFYAAYSINNFSVTLNNYFVGNANFFEFKKTTTLHAGELALSYTLSESFPLQITLGTMIYGDDKKIDGYDANNDAILSDKNNYSTYFELMYPISHNETEINFVLGGVTHESYFYDSENFGIINLGVKVAKTIKITESFSLPVSFALIANPELESVYTAFVISF